MVRIRRRMSRAVAFLRVQFDPARTLARLRPSDYLRPDRLWQRQTPLAYVTLLVLLLASTLL